jgi:hypothetical protein
MKELPNKPEPANPAMMLWLIIEDPWRRVVRRLRAFMKAIICFLVCCLSVFAVDTNEIRVVTRTDSHVSPGYLVTYEEFTGGGQTNLIRVTSVKDGATNSLAHNFYHRGVYPGRYSQGSGYSFINSAAGAPYVLTFVLDSSNQVRAASVTSTNYVILDSFTCTNGIFYPEDSSRIEESNRKTKDFLHR